MLIFDYLERGRGIASPSHLGMIFLQKCFLLCCILLVDQISLSDFLYFLKYRAICVLQVFVSQVVTS